MANLKLNYASLLVVTLVMAFLVKSSEATNADEMRKWGNTTSINLFREALEYTIAVMNQGIPALGVPPLDPYFLNTTEHIQVHFDPRYPRYTDMNVKVHGITFSEFSQIEVLSALLDLDDMASIVYLFQDVFQLQSPEIEASAVGAHGEPLFFSCVGVRAELFASLFIGKARLELNNTELRVAEFDNEYRLNDPLVEFGPATCTGDYDLQLFLMDTLSDALRNVTSITIPQYFADFNYEISTLLNDIFALRNITDDDSVSFDVTQKKVGDDRVSRWPDAADQGHVKRLSKQQSLQNGVRKPVDARVDTKWSF